MSVSILLADDHGVVRQGLRSLLESQPGFRVVGEACDGIQAIQLIHQLHPDVTVLDIMMPGLNGLEVTRQVYKITRVVILSMHSDRSYVSDALHSGACGFVLKDASAEELIAAIHTANSNKIYLSKPFSDQPVTYYMKNAGTPREDALALLTPRERQVLQLVVEGSHTEAIAARLNISPRTVELHRSHILQKFNVHNQADLVKIAYKMGLLHL